MAGAGCYVVFVRKRGVMVSVGSTSRVPVCRRVHGRVILNVSSKQLTPNRRLPAIQTLTRRVNVGSVAIDGTCALLGRRNCVCASHEDNTHIQRRFRAGGRLSRGSRRLLHRVVSRTGMDNVARARFFSLYGHVCGK